MNINRDKIVQLVDTDTIENLTSALSQRLIADQLRLTTAESCTGGKLASALCAAEDTPKFYGAGFVTFTDQAKMKILSVSQQSLERYSAVSEKVAAEMATGAIERAQTYLPRPLSRKNRLPESLRSGVFSPHLHQSIRR